MWKHLDFKHLKKKLNNWQSKIEFELLNIAISEVHTEIDHWKKRLKFLNRSINRLIPVHIADKFRSTQKAKNEKLFMKIRTKQSRKFDKLPEEKFDELRQMTKPHWTVNISSTEIPEYVENVLSLGPNFGLPYKYKEVPIIQVMSSIESALYNNPYAEEIRAQVVNITTNFIQNYKQSNNTDKFLLAQVSKTKKFLEENQQIIVINADKGNTTLVMNRSEYESSMNKLISDESTYEKTKRDPTNRIEKKVNEMITTWRLNNKISEDEETYLKTHNSVAPAIYGLGKLHKRKPNEDIPFRPVVSTVQSPSYKISKLIANCLSKVMKESEHHLKDSWQFAERIKEVNIPNGYKLISLDATSFFTSIPMNLCTKAIKARWKIIKPHTYLTQVQFIEAIKLIISESYFCYKDEFYIQKSGLAMGSSISGFLADREICR